MAGYRPPGHLSRAWTDLCAAENDPIKFSSKLPSTKPSCALTAKWLQTAPVGRGWQARQEGDAPCFHSHVLPSPQILAPALGYTSCHIARWGGEGAGQTRLTGHRTERNSLKDRTFLRGKCTKPVSSYCTPGSVSAWRLLSVISLAPSSGLHAG